MYRADSVIPTTALLDILDRMRDYGKTFELTTEEGRVYSSVEVAALFEANLTNHSAKAGTVFWPDLIKVRL